MRTQWQWKRRRNGTWQLVRSYADPVEDLDSSIIRNACLVLAAALSVALLLAVAWP